MAELLQHLLAMGQVWSHELGSIHLDLLPYFPGGQARLGEDRRIQLKTKLTHGSRFIDYGRGNCQEGKRQGKQKDW